MRNPPRSPPPGLTLGAPALPAGCTTTPHQRPSSFTSPGAPRAAPAAAQKAAPAASAGWGDAQAGLDASQGSQTKVTAVGVPAQPQVIAPSPLDGFVSDPRRVGDVIYAVSNLYSWITHPGIGNGADDLTYVMS